MLFEQFFIPGIAHFSYAVGSRAAGEIAIVDPERDIVTYQRYAVAHNVRIAHVLETHIGADYVSGALALAESTGATLHQSAYDKGETFEIAYPHHDIYEDNVISMGAVHLKVVHTPGHTPEHIAFLVYDSRRSTRVPMLMLTGDLLFVGSIGRPDLLGTEQLPLLAGQLYATIHTKLASLPDGLAIYPAHGSGSLCGRHIADRRMTTLGYERAANAYLTENLTKEAFITQILSDLPPFPDYAQRIKQINATGAKSLEELGEPQPLSAEEFQNLAADRHWIIDLREAEAFGQGHPPGALALTAGPFLSPWAAWLIPAATPLLLIAAHKGQLQEGALALARVGLERIAGYLEGGMPRWHAAGLPVESIPQLDPGEAHQRFQNRQLDILDVRSDTEREVGYIPGTHHIAGGDLIHQIDNLGRKERPMATLCSMGYVSNLATSLLTRAGYTKVHHVKGGITAWQAAGLPLSGKDEQIVD